MKEIVKVLLAEGICEEVIHEVLDVIEEKYELVDEGENLVDVVRRAEKEGKISKDKAGELEQKAFKIEGTNDIFVDQSGKRNFDKLNSVKNHNKNYYADLSQKVDALEDPTRIKRKEELGKVIDPKYGSQYTGDEAFRQIRINRKKEKVANKNK